MNAALILADCELELVPERASRCARALPVLDAYYHRELMKGLPEGSRRGRPDIVHNSLQLVQASPSFREGSLGIFIHTRNDEVIEVARDADIAPNYVQFLVDMGALLGGEAVNGYRLTRRTFKELIHDIAPTKLVAMSPEGREAPLADILRSASGESIAIVVGGFPEGDYTSPVYELADEKVSLGPRLMRVPEVVTAVLLALG